MSYLVLARKWRPKNFSEMTGQSHVVRSLSNSLDSGNVHHAFLFTGTRGVGKTTVARILAKALNCERGVSSTPCGVCSACRQIAEGRFVDLIEVDAASRTKVDDTRELLDNVQYAPSHARFKVYLIDEVHMLSNHSFNALLKTLEEPPPHVKFLLATTDPQKLPLTVLSRCLHFNLQRLSPALINARLEFIAREEGLNIEAGALQLVARAADGSLRDALSLLDQFLAFGGGELTERMAREMLATVDRGRLVEVLRALAVGDAAAVLSLVAEIDRDAPDYDRALVELAALLQRIAVRQAAPQMRASDDEAAMQELDELAGMLEAGDVQLYYQIALHGRRELSLCAEGKSGFEMTLLRMLAFRPDIEPQPVRAERPQQPAKAPYPQPGPSEEPKREAIAFDSRSWPSIIEKSELTAMVRQFALNCVPASFEGDVLTLSVDPVAAERRTAQIEDKMMAGLRKLVGREIRLQFASQNADMVTPARQRMLDQEQRQQRAAAAFEADPAVRGLRERFGASIDPASIKAGAAE